MRQLRFITYIVFGLLTAILVLSCGNNDISGYNKTFNSQKISSTDKDDSGLADSTETVGPQLTIKEVDFDFGYTPQSSKIKHKFTLHSTGNDTLRILQVRPG